MKNILYITIPRRCRQTLTAGLCVWLAACLHTPPNNDDSETLATGAERTAALVAATGHDVQVTAMPEATDTTDTAGMIPADDFDTAFEVEAQADQTLWTHIRDGFELEPHLDKRLTQVELDWYREHRDYLDRVMIRAEPFLYYILTEAQKRDLPTELVLLPIVESAFQPFAYSHGRAAGLWQFIPSTGRMYGLKQNWWYDGRRDIYASTQAALNYLNNLGKEFDGDWLLALAAYNAGSGNVQRAIRANRKHNKPTDFWSLDLPRETENYVPKLLALKEIISNPREHEVTLHCIPYAPGFREVDTGSQIDLALAAELAGMDIDTLYAYNPAFNRWATAPDGPHTLLMPADAAEVFEQNLAELGDAERVRWKRHPIANGETLSDIATIYHTTVAQLKAANKLKGTQIRAGKFLMIPIASRARTQYTLSASQRKQATQNTIREGKSRVEHSVRAGDSFWEISRKYAVDMHSLAKWNGMAVRDPLREGQKLVVWVNPRSDTPQASASIDSGPASSEMLRTISYTVRSGDSLSRIADRYNVSINDIHRWNSINGKYLQPGQKLKLFIDVRNQST